MPLVVVPLNVSARQSGSSRVVHNPAAKTPDTSRSGEGHLMKTVQEIRERADNHRKLSEGYLNDGDMDEAYIQRALQNTLLWTIGDVK
jgi:hypothetical protein